MAHFSLELQLLGCLANSAIWCAQKMYDFADYLAFLLLWEQNSLHFFLNIPSRSRSHTYPEMLGSLESLNVGNMGDEF